jgi:hypothetical protein
MIMRRNSILCQSLLVSTFHHSETLHQNSENHDEKNSALRKLPLHPSLIDTLHQPLELLLLFFAWQRTTPFSHYILNREADEEQQAYQHTMC